jgi:hypothetical protein
MTGPEEERLPSTDDASRQPPAARRRGLSKRSPAPRNDLRRIVELKAKLGDDAYMAGAILRIATVLSARLTEGYLDGGRTTKRQARIDGTR